MSFIYFLWKLIITVIVIKTLYCWFKRHICILALIFSGMLIYSLSNAVVNIVPPLKDEITITALNGTDVFIQSYMIDKKVYPIENAIEGKWFWLGSRYGWRDESDQRQPKGVTRNISLRVPVGYHREIDFDTGDGKGVVQIDVREVSVTADTEITGKVVIPGSRLRMIAANLLWQGMFFLLAELVLGFIICLGFYIWSENVRKERYFFLYMSVCLAVLYLAMVIPSSSTQSFWLDEMYQIGFSGGDRTVLDTFFIHETTPPLYRVLVNLWYDLVPYGEGFLLLLSEFFVAAAIVVTAFAGRVYKNAQTGIIAAVLTMTSVFVTKHCSYELRSYSLLLLLSAACLWVFIARWKSNKYEIKAFIIQWLVMILLCYTHYFGLFLCISVFLVDLTLSFYMYRNNNGQVKGAEKCLGGGISPYWKKFWFMYSILGLAYLPWVFRVIAMGHLETKGIGSKVTVSSFYYILYTLLDSNIVRLLVCCIGVSVIIVEAVYRKRVIDSIPVAVVVVLFSGVAVYGISINTGLTLWADRYFTPAFPWLTLVMAAVINRSIDIMIRMIKMDVNKQEMAFCIVSATLLLYLGIPSAASWYSFMQQPDGGQDYRSAANWLYDYQDGEIYLDRVAVAYIRSVYGNEGKGWYEYYITKKGTRDAPDFISDTSTLSFEDFITFYNEYDTVFLCTMPFQMDQCNREWIDWIREYYELTDANENYQIYIFRKNKEDADLSGKLAL